MKNLETLKNKIEIAIYEFLSNDKILLKNKAHEQSISHRIAVYLEPLFKGYNIDCEYNKHKHDDIKSITSLKNERKSCKCKSCVTWRNRIHEDDAKNIDIRPDIIVHNRGNDKNNLIVIEIKKDDDCLFDKAKLRELTNPIGNYRYKLGVFIKFTKKHPQFKQGSEMKSFNINGYGYAILWYFPINLS